MLKNKDWDIPYKYDEIMESRKWMNEIPLIRFPSDWKIRFVPPFGGLVVRFHVVLPGMRDEDRISIYLDCYDKAGCMGAPYWEVYPYQGDCGRCWINETDKLLEMIADRSETGSEPESK